MARVLRNLSAGSGPDLIGGDPHDCARALDVDGIAVSLVVPGAAGELVWSTPGVGTALDDLQSTLGEGPTPDATRSCALVLESDLTRVRRDRWPILLPAAIELGVGAVFCFPLRLGGACPGVLTLHRGAVGPLSAATMDDALIVATALTAVVLDGGARADAFADAESPTHLHRAVVHQAGGMISVQASVSVEQALVLLRAHAYRHDRPLLEVAEDVVRRRLRFAPTDGGA
ncbi:ANTAR domain-containing protein [Embleya sp. NBC_00896]|uniref:ANTAR domain-containing protein n=1 Tax=Embleya sp. NBC_00896 TaxID=2975961 RepID=UPI00386864E2|nr:ANTAR domain-containing protein [Embleya sp. NBC_00896]